jgi:hypothetical protein
VAELSKEVFESLPEVVQGDYELTGNVYTPKSEAGLAEAKASFKQKMDELGGKYQSAEQRLREIETSKADDIRKARDEALQEALSKGQTDEVMKRYEEQMEDLKARAGESENQYKQRIDALETGIKSSKRSEYLGELRAKLDIFPESAKLFDRVVGSMIEINAETGKRTFLSDDGSATSLDDAGFMSQIESDPAFSHLRKAKPTGEGGFANGSNSSGGATDSKTNQAALDAKKSGDLNGFLNASLKSN